MNRRFFDVQRSAAGIRHFIRQLQPVEKKTTLIQRAVKNVITVIKYVY